MVGENGVWFQGGDAGVPVKLRAELRGGFREFLLEGDAANAESSGRGEGRGDTGLFADEFQALERERFGRMELNAKTLQGVHS